MTHNPPTSQLDLDAIQARIDAATKGPWTESGIGDYGWGVGSPAEHIVEADDSEQGRANAAFIAHARTDVEQLVAEVRRLRAERRRYCIAWRMARTRALSTGGAADRYAARAREGQTAMQDMLGALLGAQMERDELQAKVAALRTVLASREPAVRPAVETGA